MTVSRRVLAAAARRMREEPSSVVELIVMIAAMDADDGEPDAMTPEQLVALGWWWASQPEAQA